MSGIHDICTRVSDEPLIKPIDVKPSDSRLEVIGVLNPTFINIGGSRHLIVRVDERPVNSEKIDQSRNQRRDKMLIAHANIEAKGRVDIFEVEVPEGYLPDKEPILPKSVRRRSYRVF